MSGRPERVLLVGMMGVGKSTAGRLIAEELGWPYLDTDEEVPKRTGRTIAQIWEDSGEAAFRTIESEVIAEFAGRHGPAVIALGGGSVLDPANRSAIKRAGLVVWLRADPATLFGRVGRDPGRPLLRDDPADALRRLSESRAAMYESVADLVFDVDRLSPRDVAEQVAEALKEQPCTN